MSNTRTFQGRYNGRLYAIEDAATGERLYQGGNAYGDSQGYLDEHKGVGVDAMKVFCASTLGDMCEEQGANEGELIYDNAMGIERNPW